jgi:hypothetical protein
VPRIRLRPPLLPLGMLVTGSLALSGRPRDVGDVSAHRRYRTVDEEKGLKVFIGVRISAPSPDALLAMVETLADWLKAAKQDALEARNSGEWDVVHDIELVVGNDAMRMEAAGFAQYVHDLRYREIGARQGRTAGERLP